MNLQPKATSRKSSCGQYLDFTPKLFAAIRDKFSFDEHLLHDMHHRLTPIEAARFGKSVELFAAAVCVALAGTVKEVNSAVMMMSISIFFLYITDAIYWAIIQDVVHKSRVGSISGFINLVGSLSGIIGSIVTGFIVHTPANLTAPLCWRSLSPQWVLSWCCSLSAVRKRATSRFRYKRTHMTDSRGA